MSRLLCHLSYTAAPDRSISPLLLVCREVPAALVEPQYGIEP
jgi:hypothetical protein